MDDEMPRHDLTLIVRGFAPLILRNFVAVIAGYTGRDAASVRRHIDELAAHGVAPPEQVPTFYQVERHLITQENEITVSGPLTSGEVEPVLIRHSGDLYLAVGSDHTDRDIERRSVLESKAACAKPISREAVALSATTSAEFDSILAYCEVDGRPYQSGRLRDLLSPEDLLVAYERQFGAASSDLVMFGGTFPLLDGKFVAGNRWDLELRLPDSTSLKHTYLVRNSPSESDGIGDLHGEAGN
jgi:Protein of unknown function (DUF2848)